MFENLRNAFREALDNFNKELNRDDVPDVVDGLLRQMHEEATDAKAQLHSSTWLHYTGQPDARMAGSRLDRLDSNGDRRADRFRVRGPLAEAGCCARYQRRATCEVRFDIRVRPPTIAERRIPQKRLV